MNINWQVFKATVTGIERQCIPRKCIAQCDECGDQYLGGSVWGTQAENEQELRTDGWLIMGDNVHICPLCKESKR